MTVAKTTQRIAYVPNGTTTDFSVPFSYESDSLNVYLDGTLTAGYSLSPAFAGDTGGTLSFATAPASTYSELVIERSVADDQPDDYINNGPPAASTLEGSLDHQARMVQDAKALASRAVRVPDYENTDMTLPDIASRAGAYAAYDSSGKPTIAANPTATATIDISALPAISATDGTEEIPVLQGGLEKRMTSAQVVSLASKTIDTLADLNAFVPDHDGQVVFLRDAQTSGANGGRACNGTCYLPGGAYTAAELQAFITSDPQGGIYQPLAVDTTGASGVFARHVEGAISAKWFGATGDGSTDDITAIQAAVNFTFGPDGGELFLPNGTYNISDNIVIPVCAGWRLQGESRLGTKLVQTTTNTPIFYFANADTHSWDVSDMELSYSTQQTSATPNGCPFWFVGPSSGGASVAYYWNVARVTFDNCYYCFGADSTSAFALWGYRVESIWAYPTVTGGIASFIPGTLIGMPNGSWDQVFVRADNMTGPLWLFSNQNDCNFDNIEINNLPAGVQILKDNAGGFYRFGTIRSEHGTFDGTSALFELYSSNANFNRLELKSTTINVTTGTDPYVIRGNASGGGKIRIETLTVYLTTVTAGTMYVIGGFGNSPDQGNVEIGNVNPSLPTGVYLSDNSGTASSNAILVREWMAPRQSDDNGDASVTLTIGAETIQRWDTTLTAARAVTLPADADDNAFDGLRFTIVLSASSSYDLSINKSGGGTVATIPAGTVGSVTVIYRRLDSWRVLWSSVEAATITKLSDPTGGTISTGLFTISGSGADSSINHNFASLNALIGDLIVAMQDARLMQ